MAVFARRQVSPEASARRHLCPQASQPGGFCPEASLPAGKSARRPQAACTILVDDAYKNCFIIISKITKFWGYTTINTATIGARPATGSHQVFGRPDTA